MNNAKRNREIYILNLNGHSLSEIATMFGLSRERVRQICIRERTKIKIAKSHEDAVTGKKTYTFVDALMDVCGREHDVARIINRLNRLGIDLEFDLATSKCPVDLYSDEELLNISGFGETCLRYVREASNLYKEKTLASISK